MLVLVAIQSVIFPWMIYIANYLLDSSDYRTVEDVDYIAAQPLWYAMIAFMPLAVNILFDFLNERKASDFYHALPVYRSAMYVSNFAAVFTWIMVFAAASFVTTFLSYGIIPVYNLVFTGEYVFFIRVSLVAGLYLTSVLILARNISGTKFSIAMTGLFIIVLPRAVISFVFAMTSMVCEGVMMEQSSIIWNPAHNILWRVFSVIWNNELPMSATYTYTTVLSLIYIAVAGVLFVLRKSEKAESIAISPVVQRVLSFIPSTVFCFLPIAFIIEIIYEGVSRNESTYAFLFFFYVIALIIYLLYELITVRKFLAVWQAFKKAWILIVINVVLLGVILISINVTYSQKPTAQQINYVSLRSEPAYINIPSYLEDEVYSLKIKDEDMKVLVADAVAELEKGSYYSSDYRDVKVKINYGGRSIYRQLSLDSEKLREILLNNSELVSILCELPDYKTIRYANLSKSTSYNSTYESVEGNTLKLIYDSLKEEKESLSVDEWSSVVESTHDRQDVDTSLWISFNYFGNDSEGILSYSNYTGYFEVFIDQNVLPKTYALVKEYYPHIVDFESGANIY